MPRALKQGDLDGLCGMYAVVNALNHLLSIKPPPGFNEEMFEVVARSVPRREYPEVLWEGMDVETLTRIARRATRHFEAEYEVRITVERPFARRRFRDRHAYFDAVSSYWDKQYSTFIVFIDWPKSVGHAHWSVLKTIEDQRICLVDSGGQHALPTARMGVNGDRGTRLHPPSTLMLTLESIGGEPVELG